MEKNNAQEEIIHTVNGQLLVVACPGSGKTTTLLRRIHYMINEAKIPAQQILMVTFSSAAAKEMKTRYQKKFGMDAVTFSTIHSMCMSILKKFGGYTKEDMIALMSYLRGEMIKRNSFIEDLDAAVKRAREKEDWKVEYMALSLKFQDAMEEGRAEGRAEMQQNIVIKLLSANQFSDKEICSIVDISEEKLEEYKKMYMD